MPLKFFSYLLSFPSLSVIPNLSLPESILSPLFPTSLLPLSPFLSFPLSDAQMFTADSSTCRAWGPGRCSCAAHGRQSNGLGQWEKSSQCQSKDSSKYEPGRRDTYQMKWESVRATAVYVCVLEQGQHTMCYF